MIEVTIIKAFSDASQETITLASGSTVGAAASRVGAPSGCTYMRGGSKVSSTEQLGNGDQLVITRGKVDAG